MKPLYCFALAAALLFSACNDDTEQAGNTAVETRSAHTEPETATAGKDLSPVQKGMKEAQVEELLGEPDDIQQLPMDVTHWKYGENQVVVFSGDTVVNVIPDFKKQMEDINNLIDSLERSKRERDPKQPM